MRKGAIRADGKKIRQLRERKGWNQAALAAKAGLQSTKTITQIEGGRPVLIDTLGRVASALGVEPHALVRGLGSSRASSGTRTPPDNAKTDLLPIAPSLLIGREKALREVKRRLGVPPTKARGSQLRVVIQGWPGVGKTTLIAAVAHDADISRVFPDGVLWASLGQNPNLFSELTSWGRAIGSEGLRRSESVKEANAQLAQHVQGKRFLLILDDVWDVAHAEAFRVGGKTCATLVTTRIPRVAESLSSPDEAFNLDVLSDEESVELLRTLAPAVVRKFPRECAELAHDLEGLPLALQVAGRLLRIEAKRGWDVREFLRELHENAAHILDAKAPADMVDLVSETSPTVAALLKKSTDQLGDEIRERFAYLGAFAPKPGTFSLEDMTSVWEVSPKDTKRTADELIDRGLLEATGNGRFWMHALLIKLAGSLCSE